MCNCLDDSSESKGGNFWLVFIQRSAVLMIDQSIDCVCTCAWMCVSTMKGINNQAETGNKWYTCIIYSLLCGWNQCFIPYLLTFVEIFVCRISLLLCQII